MERCLNCKIERQVFRGSFFNTYEGCWQVYCRYCGYIYGCHFVMEQAKHHRDYLLVKKNNLAFKMAIVLNDWQRKSIISLKYAIAARGKKILLQAICGSGKTEIMAVILVSFLRQNKKVAWATPRKDIVIDLLPRLKRYFPTTKIIGLYEDSPDLNDDAPFILLTTARLSQFIHIFDVLIVDENDAFPYKDNIQQQEATKRAITEEGCIFFLSATVQRQNKHDYDFIIQLTKRFHLHPHPLPQYKKIRPFFLQRGAIFPKSFISKIVHYLEQRKCVFIFVPTKAMGRRVVQQLIHYSQNLKTTTLLLSSETKNRANLLQKINDKHYQIVVTTTVLERGVTFENTQVIVFQSDHQLFDTQTLIQICGRVGRSLTFPSGDIYFLYEKWMSNSMCEARKYIEEMNKGSVFYLR